MGLGHALRFTPIQILTDPNIYKLIKYPRGYIFNINAVGTFLHYFTLIIRCNSQHQFITHRTKLIFRKINFITIENKMQ